MNKIYKLKDGIDIKDCLILEEYGFDIEPISELITIAVPQPFDGSAVDFLLTKIYANPQWKKEFYDKNRKMFKQEYDLKFDKAGHIVITDKFKEILTTWFLIIELDNGWVGFTHCDKRNQMVYYGKKVLDDYCPREIFHLLDLGLIEEAEVEEE